jgi:uncharacterized SAM-binding protein YcdF (DUF218 family)
VTWLRRICRGVRLLLVGLGLGFIAVLILPLTPAPWNWYGSLAQPGVNAEGEPAYIVMMGGGGIPSESGLTRSYKTAEAARAFPLARIVVAMPVEEGETDAAGIVHELTMRGVDGARILRERRGRNTREQAIEVHRLVATADSLAGPIVGLVTSPEHMKRTWHSFRKAGFTRLIALPSWPEPITADLRYEEKELGAISLGGAIGGNDMIKYRYWDNLGLLVRCLREEAAFLYYRLMRWV